MSVAISGHPLVQHWLTVLRQRETDTGTFRNAARQISALMAYDVLGDLPLDTRTIETPLETMQAPCLAQRPLCFVSILRAGSGILDGMLDVAPWASVGHIGLDRDPATLQPRQYYLKLPDDIRDGLAVLVDPMLATGHSACAALSVLKEAGCRDIRLVCLLAAPEGVATVSRAHPDVRIHAAAVDRALDAHGYIRPGLGDAGDRLFGTYAMRPGHLTK